MNDDGGKKRGSRQVAGNEPHYVRADKKLKKPKAKIPNDDSEKHSATDHESAEQIAFAERLKALSVSTRISPKNVQQSPFSGEGDETPLHWNFESALTHVVQMGSDLEKEVVSSSSWIKFRLGTAGDAADLEECLHSNEPASEPNESSEAGTLSIENRVSRLADALGDEDRPPYVYAMIGEVISEEEPDNHPIEVAALLSPDEIYGKVRIKKIYVNEVAAFRQMIERRLLLRLATLSVLTGFDVVDESRYFVNDRGTKNHSKDV